MPYYHFNAQVISRGDGHSVVAADAYISGGKLRDSYTGRTYDYSYREDILFKEILQPDKAPPEFLDRQVLMDAINTVEKRCDSQLARIINAALANELPFDRQIALAREYAEKQFIQHGLCADVAIHRGQLNESRKPLSIEPVHERSDNPHVHIIVPFRTVAGEDGFNKSKTQTRYMNRPEYLIGLRKEWAALLNREFERNRLDIRVSHESFKVQGITDREPTIHIGAAAMALELRGIQTERGDMYRDILERNRERDKERERDRERMWERER